MRSLGMRMYRHWIVAFVVLALFPLGLLAADASMSAVKPDLGLGAIKLGVLETDFAKLFKNSKPQPVGDSGQCVIYDIERPDLQRLMPWIDTNVLELVFSGSRPGGQQSKLVQISIGLSVERSKALSDEYAKLLGRSTALNDHVESWHLADGSKIDISHYSDQSSVSLIAAGYSC